MSMYTDMQQCKLMVNSPVDSHSGAQKDNYVFFSDIDVSIYKNNALKNVATAKYQDSTHNGITYFDVFEDGKEYQIVLDKYNKYYVTDFNTAGRQTTLLLKRIDFYG